MDASKASTRADEKSSRAGTNPEFALHHRIGRIAASWTDQPRPRYAGIPQNRGNALRFEIMGVFIASQR
jgi:hypothetical protein